MIEPADTIAYDDDFFVWTQQQAAALRRIPAAAFGNDVDIGHVAEEIEDLGRRDLREVTSLIRLTFEHLLKIQACPSSPSVLHWRAEIRAFQRLALDTFTPGMRRALAGRRRGRAAAPGLHPQLRAEILSARSAADAAVGVQHHPDRGAVRRP